MSFKKSVETSRALLYKKATVPVILFFLKSDFILFTFVHDKHSLFSVVKSLSRMPLTDITNATQNEHITTDNYTCGVIIGRFEASQTPAEIHRQMGIPRSTIVDCINSQKKICLSILGKAD